MHKLKLQLNTALALTMAVGFAQPAFAQNVDAGDSAAEDSSVITVTGSRIARKDATSVGPLATLTNEDIAVAAPTSVGDILQSMPSVGVSLNSNGTQGTSFGVSSINLRYLGSAEGSGNRTLVLVDGKRWVNAVGGRGFRDFVDLNTIPLGIIDRIEVLKDGASAIYGADAIAGVVNIHTKRRLDGLEASARVGLTSRGDNQNYSGYVNFGKIFDGGSFFVSSSYNDTKPILTSDRAITARALTPLTSAPTSPQGLYVLPGLASNAYFGTPANFGNSAANAIARNFGVTTIGSGAAADNDFHVARLPGDDYNTLTQGIYATGPSKRYGVFGRATLDISDSITFTAEALYNYRKSSQLFTFTVDWFKINVDDAIAAQTASQILTSCANTGTFCDLVTRASSGEITQLRQAVVNLSRIEVSGIDATARYRTDLGAGKIEASIDVSYLDSFKSFIPQPNGTITVDERAGKSDQPRSTFPRWKGTAGLRYSSESWSLGWKTRYIGSSDDIPNNAVNGGKVGEVLYHDIQASVNVSDGRYSFAVGVDNVFDRQPPASAANNPINFDIYTYDIRGRYMYVRVGTKF